MNTSNLFSWMKRRWLLCALLLLTVYLALSFMLKPVVLYGTITPEVALINHETRVTITVTVKPSFLHQYVRLYQTDEFAADPKYLTNLDKVGEGTYQKTFTYSKDQPQTLAFGVNAFNFPFYLPGSSPFLRVGFTQRPLALPPDPYNNDLLTLAGIDSDHDGLRDVLQREVFFMYPGSEKIRKALWYMTKAETYDYLPLHSDSEAAEKTIALFKAQGCLYDLVGADSVADGKKEGRINSYVTNSIIRIQNKKKYSIFSRSVSYLLPPASPKYTTCSFDPSSLPD